MFIVDSNGNVKKGPYARLKPKQMPSNANDWFRKGLEFFDGNLVDDALRCFGEAKRLGHEKAENAIQICKNHGANFPPTQKARKQRRDMSEFF